jgi:D-alanyl-D-alanine carboxypeptidase
MQKNILALLIYALSSFQQAPAQNFNKEKLDTFFNALETYKKSMGTILIARNDTLVYDRSIGYGVYSDTKKELLTEKSRYRIGSITKMFTAVMIFQLIEEHKLALSTPLSVYFPQIPNSTKITIANLLSHRSGLYNYTIDWDSWRFTPQTQEQMLKVITNKKPDFEPGTKTAYSNSNYLLLGYIIETICKQTYAEAVKKRISSKIGLKDTYYGGKVNAGKREVYSYQWVQETWKQQPDTDMTAADGAGAMVSTPSDLTKFISALFSHKLIYDTSLQHMLTIKDGQGLGIEQLPFYDKLVYGHSGMIDLFQSWVLYFPKEKVSVVYTSNGYGGLGINDILKGILHIYFDKAYTIPNFKVIQLKPEELDKYTGVYTCSSPAMKLTITKKGNTLIGQAAGQSSFPLEAVEQNKFQFSQAGIIMEFFPDKNKMVLFQGGSSFTFSREN